MEALVNKVSQSGIIVLDLSTIIPDSASIKTLDIKPFLFQGMILKEKEFRASLDAFDFSVFAGQYVCIRYPEDAIVPKWAYMLLAKGIAPFSDFIFVGKPEEALQHFTIQAIERMEISPFINQRIVVKGCGEKPVSDLAYLTATRVLLPHVKSVMYGEPCSTVPIFKKKI